MWVPLESKPFSKVIEILSAIHLLAIVWSDFLTRYFEMNSEYTSAFSNSDSTDKLDIAAGPNPRLMKFQLD